MSGPLVSVVLPTHNREKTLAASIRSVLDQTYRNLELIVVDDGSTDGTANLLAAIRDPRLRVVALPESQGASGARNAGIDAARGEWIAFQDSDDIWLPEKLEKQVRAAAALPETYGMVYCSYWRVDGAAREQLPRPGPGLDGDLRPRLLRMNVITTQTTMVRTSAVRAIGGFDLGLEALDDWDFALRISERWRIRWVPEPLVEYYLQPDSITRSPDRFVVNYQRLMDKHREAMIPDAPSQAWHLAIIGNRLCREGWARRGRSFLGRAWRLQPFDYRYVAAWLVSWLPARLFSLMQKYHATIRST